jgi:hypothetical protein
MLAMLSAGMIIYFGWPDGPQQQHVSIRDQHGESHELVVSVGSPAWERVVEARERWLEAGETVQLPVYVWQHEVADHYELLANEAIAAAEKASRGEILSASEVNASAANLDSTRLADYQHSAKRWKLYRERIASRLRGVEQQRQHRIANLEQSPIVIGKVFQGGKHWSAFAFAVTGAIVVGGGFSAAARRWPRMVMKPSSSWNSLQDSVDLTLEGQNPISDRRFGEFFAVDLPDSWFRVSQSRGVAIRHGALSALVLAAIVLAAR